MHKVGAFDISFLTLDSTTNSANFYSPDIEEQSRILDPLGRDHIQRWKVKLTQAPFENMDDELQLNQAA